MSTRIGRSWIGVSVALSVLIAALLVGGPTVDPATAQDATPAAGAAATTPPQFEGVAVEYLSNGTGGAVGDNVLELVRITLLPGAAIPSTTHPGSALVYVERGTVDVSTDGGPALDLVESGPTSAFATETDDGCADTCTLEAGDSVVLADGATVTISNPGAVPAVVLVSSVVPPDSGVTAYFCDRNC